MNLPHFVSSAISKIEDAKFSAYAVGGCVRDSILGRTPTDWDIATSALPWDIEKIFHSEHVIPTGIKHGTVTVIWEDVPLEITTFRVDGDYRDSRHPENVTFSASIEEDLSRRDFSVNAMAYSPIFGIIDPFGGQEDLKCGIIRAVGNPKTRFGEDALRIMRAVRFAAQLGFGIEIETFRAMDTCAKLLENISAERITSEFSKILISNAPGDILNKTFNITSQLFFGEASKNDLEGFASILDNIPCNTGLRLSAYLILAASRLDKDCLTLAKSFFDRMKFPNNIKSLVISVLTHWNGSLPDNRISVKKMISQTGFDTFQNLLTIKSIFDPEQTTPTKTIVDEIISNDDCFSFKQLDVTGNDLKDTFGLSGSMIGTVLNKLLDAVIEERCENKKDTLLNYLKNVSENTL
ncbi:MAG: CCA tRNA nucleotidyltransferase [Clostridia bacterium]|nr:CCA tRNA nucleotidyltransferase [Clostridia bacterium]